MIDSHCHLDCDAFAADRGAVLARAAARGVTDIVVPGTAEGSWLPILELQRTAAPRCHAALGIHPVALPEMDPADDEAVLARLAEQTGMMAIGECGLDMTIDLERAPLARQERVLAGQLVLARQKGLPVILHARGHAAYLRLLEVLDEVPGAVIHSYGGGVDLVRKYAERGTYFGFAGPATYRGARKVQASLRAVPDTHLLVETDAPDQTPEPHRPGRSEPSYVADVLAGMAQVLGCDVAELAASTTVNAKRLFGI